MILKGDCIKVMQAMKDNSVDAVICDPPYGLEFMGKDWDAPWKYGFAKHGFSDGGNRKPAPQYQSSRNPVCLKCHKHKRGSKNHIPCTCKIPEFDEAKHRALDAYKNQLWHTQWLTEAYRVLKPGASMLVMGGTRTFHRLMVAIEDSGFIIKDTLMHLYGSGFPKAQDLGKMIDKRGGQSLKRFGKLLKEARLKKGLSQKDVARHFPSKTGGLTGCVWNWEEGTNAPTIDEVNKLIDVLDLKEDKAFEAEREKIGFNKRPAGWFTEQDGHDITTPTSDLAKHWDGFKIGGIKPAYEPIVWAVKPPEGSYIDNVLKWGIGAVNVDETRISHTEQIRIKKKQHDSSLKNPKCMQAGRYKDTTELKSSGRFPANIILTHHPECEQVGVKRVRNESGSVSGNEPSKPTKDIYGKFNDRVGFQRYADSDGLEIIESWECHEDCPVKILDEQSGASKSSGGSGKKSKEMKDTDLFKFGHSATGGLGDSGGASRFFKVIDKDD